VEIRAFRGWRYAAQAGTDISGYIAPPYDILSADDKRELLARSEGNIVAVDMPHVPPTEAGPDEEYRAAAELLSKWKATGLLHREETPALYAYEQTYEWSGRTHSRRAMLCGVRATKLGKDVIPHEHTFAGPKADRLKLTQFTRMQTSPIFGFYNDPGGAVGKILNSAFASEPDARGELDGVTEKLWAITDQTVIDTVATALREVPVFIADGHHRYTTAMNYRDSLLEDGRIDADHEANFVLFALVARDDPGLLVLPTHRMVMGLEADFSLDELDEAASPFQWSRCRAEEIDLADADAALRAKGTGAMAFVGPGARDIRIARLRDPAAMDQAAPDEIPAWRRLDVAVLQRLIIDGALSSWRTDRTTVRYTPHGREVLEACRAGQAQLGVCLQGTPLASIEEIALAGASMPHKSTYFYPKLATGMVLKPVE